MRTTLDIDEGVLVAARAIARDSGTSIGAVLSDLARLGLAAGRGPSSGGFPVFDQDEDAPPITLDVVNAARDDE